jgi:hypothetical protein
MIQSLMIQNYEIQIITLTISDLVFVLLFIFYRKQFCHKIVCAFSIAYQILFLILDCLFTINY